MNEPSSQSQDEPVVDALIESLQNGLPRDLDEQEVAALLGWIASSSRNPGAQVLSDALGSSGENEALTGHAFSLLDEAIFAGETLLTGPAGVSEEREQDARRRRYRLLLSAFHPDRYPARADWLTSRSQVITRAYARFKTGQTDELPEVESPPPAARTRPPEYRGITPTWRLAERLRSRWGQDRFLAHKIIGVLALILLLPVISILLDQQAQSPIDTEHSPNPRIDLAALDLRIEQWPLPTLAAGWLEADQKAMATGLLGEPDSDSGSESLWAAIQAIVAVGVPEWLERARVGSSPGSASDSPGIQMLAFLSDTRDQIDALADAADARARQSERENRTSERPATAPATQAPGPSSQVASTPTHQQNQPNERNQPIQTSLPRGSLHLGPLANHQVGDLLNDYRSSIEAGDLEGVLSVLGREPRDNNRIGRGWFEQHYRELFNASSQRSLSLQILNATRHGQGWRVAAQYQLDLRDADSGQDDRLERDVEFVILPDPFRLKIVEIQY